MTTFESRFGYILFALAFIALGAESLLLGIPVMRLELWPKSWPDAAFVGYASGAICLAGGIALLLTRWARFGAAALAALTLLWTVALHLAHLIPTILHADYWGGAAECLAAFGAAWVLMALLPPQTGTSLLNRIAALGVPYGRICFGLALVVFGAVHFIYPDFVADFIPHWIPARLFLAYATGVAHSAAGLAILSGILPRLAATLAGIMYASWVLLLHIPRALAAPHDPFEWNGVFVAAALSGGAFLVAASFRRARG
jgi:uncharacterized membrane protein